MKILAIDFGTYSIKAIEADATFRTIQLVNYFEEPVSQSGELPTRDNQIASLGKLVERLSIKQARTIINIPPSMAITRFLTLPFVDRRKIEQSLPFELEEILPFDIEDVVLDHRILSKEGKESRIMACVTKITELEAFIEQIKGKGVDPEMITLGSIGMCNLSPVRYEGFTGVYGIVNIGHTQTNISVMQNGIPILVRTIPLGGLAITRHLMSAYKVDYQEAERAKIEQGFVLAGSEIRVTPEQQKFSDAIKEAIDPIMKELNQTLLYIRTEMKFGVDRILLCGGTSQLRNLQAFFVEDLNIPTETLQVLEGLELSQIPINPRNEAVLAESTGLALGGTAIHFRNQINFRKGEYAKVKREGLLEPQYAYLAKVASIVIALLLFNMIGKYILLSSQNRTLQNQMVSVLTKSFPKLPKTILDSPQRLKSFLEKKVDEQKGGIDAIGSATAREMNPLRVLVELSRLTPPDLTVEITSLDVINEKIKIDGVVATTEAVERLYKIYNGYAHFNRGAKTSVKPTPDGRGQNFVFEFDSKS